MASDIGLFISIPCDEALKALNIVETIGHSSSHWRKIQTPEFCRFSDEAAAIVFDRQMLLGISDRHHCSFLVVAFESHSDFVFFEKIEAGKAVRQLIRAIEPEDVWQESGSPEL